MGSQRVRHDRATFTSLHLWTVAHQALQSMEFSRQEYWSGLPFPSPGNLPNPGIKPKSPALQANSLPAEPPGKPILICLLAQRQLKKKSPGCQYSLQWPRPSTRHWWCSYQGTHGPVKTNHWAQLKPVTQSMALSSHTGIVFSTNRALILHLHIHVKLRIQILGVEIGSGVKFNINHLKDPIVKFPQRKYKVL